MTIESAFTFSTPRLNILPWREFRSNTDALADIIRPITTDAVMADLPPSWQTLNDPTRRVQWIKDREAESLCLAVSTRNNHRCIGITLLTQPHENPLDSALRIGYLFCETHWGKGYASELISGLCATCKVHGLTTELVAGVAPGNIGSVKVLTKNGFIKDENESNTQVHFYHLHL